jgi:hypothetical protein
MASVVLGRVFEIAFTFVEECQVDAAASRYSTSLRHIYMLPIETVHST